MAWMYYRRYHAGVIRVSGEGRFDFLQALGTNDVRRVARERAVFTVLTNAAGRILHLLAVLAEQDALLALVLSGSSEAALQHMQSQLEERSGTIPLAAFRKSSSRFAVSLHDESRMWEISELLPGEGTPPGGLEAPKFPGHAQRFANGSAAIALPPALGSGLLMLNPKGVTVMMIARTRLLDDNAYRAERIRRGIPGEDTELTAEFSPFEVGLGDLVDLEKGDFPGRTMLAYEARDLSRSRALVGLKLAAPITLPASVRVGEDQVGSVTSFAEHPDLGPIAMAAVRRAHAQPGNEVLVHYYANGVAETSMPATVTSFPIAP